MTPAEITDLGGSVRRELDQYPSFTLFRSAMRIDPQTMTDEEIGGKFLEWINQPAYFGPSASTSSKS
jgi:hypothetical protein